MKKYDWLYQIRGMAIIAVVVCHQQGLLHTTEWVQLLTLYSVTTFIFCAGITQAFSLENKKHFFAENKQYTFTKYISEKLKPILLAYIIATVAYLSLSKTWTGMEWDVLFNSLLTFSASSPLYFVRYFVALTFISPAIFYIINSILENEDRKSIIIIKKAGILILSFAIGYLSIGKLDLFGQSYIFVYTAGILFGSRSTMPKVKNIQLPFILALFTFGLWSTKQFYWARVAGFNNYAEGIDSIVPKLQMNPPNLSIIIYSAGCFLLFYWIFNRIEICKEKIPKFLLTPFKALTLMGKYSLDIFMWHLFVQRILTTYAISFMPNIWVKRIVFYSAMFFIPILSRIIYEKLKKNCYTYFRRVT